MQFQLIRFFLILVIAIGLAVGTAYIISDILKLPIDIINVVDTVIIVLVGIISVNLIAKSLKSKVGDYIGKTTSESISLVVQILGYTIIGIIALTTLHVGISSALFGGTVLGLVLGLAIQTSLSNVFAGLFLILSKPFNIGDRVTITTWQYGLLAPVYPPKFWSNDFLIPGYTGIITDISLMYTTILTDENVVMKIPNSIMIQAAVFVHNEEYRLVRTKYEVPKDIDPDEIIPLIEENIKKLSFIVKDPQIKVLDTTLNTYVIVIDAYCKGQYEEPPRSEIIKVIMRTVKEYQKRRVKVSNE
ncbi:mechanosensitive ion channel family protein [Sulfolobus sp. SCGC AB-777_L09]|nr:mechanosensitive ion channel family protein [Sulfolobus sp. SCGC AB-777_L09]